MKQQIWLKLLASPQIGMRCGHKRSGTGGRRRHPPVAPAPVTARKDDATAAVQAATTNVAGWDPSSCGGGLIQTTSG